MSHVDLVLGLVLVLRVLPELGVGSAPQELVPALALAQQTRNGNGMKIIHMVEAKAKAEAKAMSKGFLSGVEGLELGSGSGSRPGTTGRVGNRGAKVARGDW